MNNRILVHGVIGQEVISSHVLDALQKINNQDVVIDIASSGGCVHTATTIYNKLTTHSGRITVDITGWALSAASFIAMAGAKVRMSNTSVFMMHSPGVEMTGNARDFRKEADVLDTCQKSIGHAYALKSGKPLQEINTMLDAETWLSAEEALELGFIDEIIDSKNSKIAAHFDMSQYYNIPTWVKNMTTKQTIQTKQVKKVPPTSQANQGPEIENSGTFFINTEKKRRDDIMLVYGVHGGIEGTHGKLLFNCLNDMNCSYDSARVQLLDALGRESPGPIGGIGFEEKHYYSDVEDQSEKNVFMSAATEALLIRNGIKIKNESSTTRDVINMSIPEIARTILRLNNDYSASRYSKSEAVIKAMHSTSDFPALLSNVGGKSLQLGYGLAPVTFREWTAEHEVADFKEQTMAMLSSAPNMLEVGEYAEYRHGTFRESSQTFKIKKYGRIFKISREALINDDLSAFTRLPLAFGQRSAALEADEVYKLINDNVVLGDGNPLFDISRGNLADSGSTLSVASLGGARAAMRKQTDIDGKTVIDIQPRFLLVPADLETEAEELLSSLVDPSKNNDAANPSWIRGLTLVADPRMTGAAWYLSASPDQIETVIRAYLQGMERPYTEEKIGFETDDYSIKARLEFAAAMVDPKGLYKNPGA